MKRMLIALMLMVSLAVGVRGDVIADADAGKHVGKTVTVTAVIADAKTFKGGSEALDLGARYPNQTLVVYVPAEIAQELPGFSEGIKITVTGQVTLYEGHPEIKVDDPTQITR